jgi:hypothetical protein
MNRSASKALAGLLTLVVIYGVWWRNDVVSGVDVCLGDAERSLDGGGDGGSSLREVEPVFEGSGGLVHTSEGVRFVRRWILPSRLLERWTVVKEKLAEAKRRAEKRR